MDVIKQYFDPYTLPEIGFVGGETQEFLFYLKNKDGSGFNADGATIDFSICEYNNKTGSPILSYTPEILYDSHGVASLVHVVVPKDDTSQFFGKYIYQITIIDLNGAAAIPNQGVMRIVKNINQEIVM